MNQIIVRGVARSYRAPRLVLAVCGLLLGSGCVSQAAYEEVRSAAEIERNAHGRAQARAEQLDQALSELRSELEAREAAIQEHERRLAETDLDLKLAHREREEKGELVNQLRGDLARVGDHLKVFSEQKQRLAEELRAAEDRSNAGGTQAERVASLVRVVRDLTLLEGPSIQTGTLVLASDGEQPSLRISQATLAPGGNLGADGKRLVKSLARLSNLHESVHFVLSQRSGSKAPPEVGLLRRVSEALQAEGVPSRKLTLKMAEAGDSNATVSQQDPARAESEGVELVFVIRVDSAEASATDSSQEAKGEAEDDPGEPRFKD